ncbi:MAG: serpin family protein [Prevotella melaninogenica]
MTRKLLYVPILLLLVCCTQSKKALHILENTAKEATTSSQLTLEDTAKKAKLDYVLSEEETKFVSSSNMFSLKLFQLLANKNSKESIVLSPMAVVYSLDMINNGANGKTQEVISKALGYTADDLDAINSLNRTMLIGQRKEETNVNNESMGYMITANFLMLHEQTKLLPDFQEALEHYYFTKVSHPNK